MDQSELPNPPRQPSSVLPSLALLVGVLAAVAVGLCWKQLKNEQRRAMSHVRELQGELKRGEYQAQEMNLQLSHIQNTLQRQQVDVADMHSAVQRISPFDVEYRLLLEAEYLVRQAGLSLEFSHDVQSAIALLQAADKRVQAANNPRLIKIRQSLANNIAILQAVPALDLDGLLARLNALQEQVDKLSLFSTPKIQPVLPASQATSSITGWRKGLDLTLEALNKLMVIRHREEPLVPLISPDQEIYLKQNLQLLLQQAAWAAVHNQPALYQKSIQKASEWIKRYFVSESPATNAVITALNELQKVNINPSLPNVNQALDALQQALAQRSEKMTVTPHSPIQKQETTAQ